MAVKLFRNASKLIMFGVLLLIVKPDETSGTENLFNEIGDLAEVFGNVFGSIDNCKYTCPNGVRPHADPSHRPSANGCGSYGFELKTDSIPGMTECCNVHDYCYDTCKKDKMICDRELKHCLQEICHDMEEEARIKRSREKLDKTQTCNKLVKIIYGGVSALGCEAYMNSQESACMCPATTQGQGHERRTDQGQGHEWRKPKERHFHNGF